jgi:hypothetical protein
MLLDWTLRGAAAVILLQTLFFKFTGATESVYIFRRMGAEPWGRIGSGVFELIAALLLLIPSTAHWGALLSLGVISGAILSHVFVLGIALPEVGDGGELFALAVAVFVCSALTLFAYRGRFIREAPMTGQRPVRFHQAD